MLLARVYILELYYFIVTKKKNIEKCIKPIKVLKIDT